MIYTVLIKWSDDAGANAPSEINNIVSVVPGDMNGWALTSADDCVRWLNKDLIRMMTIIPRDPE